VKPKQGAEPLPERATLTSSTDVDTMQYTDRLAGELGRIVECTGLVDRGRDD